MPSFFVSARLPPMLEWWQKNRPFVLACVLLLVALLWYSVSLRDKEETNLLERVVLAVTGPVQSGLTSAINGSADIWEHYLYLVDTAEDNDTLIAENRKLKEQNAHLQKDRDNLHAALEDRIAIEPAGDRKGLTLENYIAGDKFVHPDTIDILLANGIIDKTQAVVMFLLSRMRFFAKEHLPCYDSYEKLGRRFGMTADAVINAFKSRGRAFVRKKTGVNSDGKTCWKWFLK